MNEFKLRKAFRKVKFDIMQTRAEIGQLKKEHDALLMLVQKISNHEISELGYIASKGATKYHSKCAFVKTIKDENKIAFSNQLDAIDAGFHPCACVA